MVGFFSKAPMVEGLEKNSKSHFVTSTFQLVTPYTTPRIFHTHLQKIHRGVPLCSHPAPHGSHPERVEAQLDEDSGAECNGTVNVGICFIFRVFQSTLI
jgi:hypothetical protein